MSLVEPSQTPSRETVANPSFREYRHVGPPAGILAGIAQTASFLVNGDSYFKRFGEELRKARRSIWIIGWDFNPDILLEPGTSNETLGAILQATADAHPSLEIRILVWALGPIYSQKTLRQFYRRDFPAHPRIALRYARQTSWFLCHHQKLVCIDDEVAFIGGVDLTSRRWDDRAHRPDSKLRRDSDGKSYDPLHDVQAEVTGDAAKIVGEIVRGRWLAATREIVPPADVRRAVCSAESVDGRMQDVPVRFALTAPATAIESGVKDGIRMTLAIIRSARRWLYIEAQYLASMTIADALAARLAEQDGPEVVIICTRSSHGFIEKLVMGKNRRRVIRRLKQADHARRLRVYYPVILGQQGQTEVLVHSKLLIGDDQSVRIGSSNLNHRSEGADTECDMLLEAASDAHRCAIAELRQTLLSEHLGVPPTAVAKSLRETGSLIETIDQLNTGPRALRPLDANVGPGSIDPVIGTALFDPALPLSRRLSFRAFLRRIQLVVSPHRS